MKRLLSAIFFVLVSLSMAAQTVVKGHVVNERGETVEYVSIGFDDENDSVCVISDAKGHFELTIPKDRQKDLQKRSETKYRALCCRCARFSAIDDY